MGAIGAFLSGAAQGYDRALEQRRTDERDERERARFEMEKKELERKDAERNRQEDIRARLVQLDQDRAKGAGIFAQEVDPAKAEQIQAVDRKAALSYGRAEDAKFSRQAGITPPGAGQAPQESASMSAPETNFFKQGGEALYKDPVRAENLYYQQLGSLLREDYANKGDLGRAALVDTEIQKMRESGYDRVRRTAAAAVLAGANPEALQPVLERAYSTLDDGRSVRVAGAQVDPKTNGVTYNLEFTDKKTGQTTVQPMNQVALFGILQQATPFEVLKYNTERGDTAKAFDLKERQLGIESKVADARIAEAGATASFRAAQQAALTDSIKGADAKARVESIAKMFPLAGSDIDPTKMLGKKPEEITQRRQQIEMDTMGLSLAERFAGLNPKVDPRIIGAAAKASFGGNLKQERDAANGRSFLNYGGTKIYID